MISNLFKCELPSKTIRECVLGGQVRFRLELQAILSLFLGEYQVSACNVNG